MDSSWIASTPNQGLRPVGTPGQRDHGVLVQVLAQHLSSDHALLFAEPVPNPDGRTTDWYAALAGEARPLETLEPATRAAAEQRLRQRYDDIRGLAQRLAQSRDADAANKAALLQAALEIPDPSYICVAGGEPVLLAWAHLEDSPDPPKGVLGSWIRTRQPTAPPPPRPEPLAPAVAPAASTIVPVIVERGVAWPTGLLWLLFALLAAAIAYLMLAACGIGWPGAGGWLMRCPVPVAAADTSELARELERQRQLEQEIAQLQRELARAAGSCRAEAAPLPPPAPEPPARAEAPPPPPPPPECEVSEIDQRRAEAGGQTGEVTVSLGWEGRADLDLAILCPNGKSIRFDNPAACGARLDVDMNAGGRASSEPIENVFWPRKPANGIYRVYVTLFDRRNDRRRAIPFRLELDVLGERRQVDGTVERNRQPMLVTQFEITDEVLPPAPPDCPPPAPEGQ